LGVRLGTALNNCQSTSNHAKGKQEEENLYHKPGNMDTEEDC